MAKSKIVSANPFGDKEKLPDAVIAELDEISKPNLKSVAEAELPDLDVEEYRDNPIAGDEELVREWIHKYKIQVEEEESDEVDPKMETLKEEIQSEDDVDEDDFDSPEEAMGERIVDDEPATDSPDGIVDKLVNDKDYAWKIVKAAREFFYEITYDYVVEKSNKVSQLEKVRTILIRKLKKTPEEHQALINIDKFLNEAQAIRKNYFERIALHPLQEELGKDMVNIEIRRLHKKGLLSKYVVYAMIFGLPTFTNGKAMLSAKRDVRDSKPISNAS